VNVSNANRRIIDFRLWIQDSGFFFLLTDILPHPLPPLPEVEGNYSANCWFFLPLYLWERGQGARENIMRAI